MLSKIRLRLPWYKEDNTFLKNFIFGVEDSLVSTVGLLAGVAAAQAGRTAIITTGLVLIVVEGFSMGIGSFLTEETTDEIAGRADNDTAALKGGITMLLSYISAGLLPLFPYFFWDSSLAVGISVACSLLGLFGLGLGTALYYKSPRPYIRAFKMFFLGGLAVFVGIVIGKIFHL
jgi:VIT1/CCC1 family predicted Fe2+/Mn2+ transporter